MSVLKCGNLCDSDGDNENNIGVGDEDDNNNDDDDADNGVAKDIKCQDFLHLGEYVDWSSIKSNYIILCCGVCVSFS